MVALENSLDSLRFTKLCPLFPKAFALTQIYVLILCVSGCYFLFDGEADIRLQTLTIMLEMNLPSSVVATFFQMNQSQKSLFFANVSLTLLKEMFG